MRVCVVGGGAAGCMAAIAAAECGAEVVLLERNEKLGKKLYITGKGRCNLTNDCDRETFFQNVISNPKFLYSAFGRFNNLAVMRFFEENGCPLKVERGNRVFPVSDKASDIISVLRKKLERLGATVKYGQNVVSLELAGNEVAGVRTETDRFACGRVILACGGKSYPLTGSDGSGYRLAAQAGHTLVEPVPSLIELKTDPGPIAGLAGLSLRNVAVSVVRNGETLNSEFGEMLFTHEGVSGPCVLTLSARINRLNLRGLAVSIDLKPALDERTLDQRILRDFSSRQNKLLRNALDELLPRSMIANVLNASELDPDKSVNAVTAEERRRLVHTLKDYRIGIRSLGPVEAAVVTAGGVRVNEVSPKTMESRLCRGLYFAGEMLDLDALTGGFNLQIAFSTGWCAGSSAACEN